MLVPLAATAVTMAFLLRASHVTRGAAATRSGTIALVPKDSSFRPIPSGPNQPHGSVRYAADGNSLVLNVRAAGLDSSKRYSLDVKVDSVTYTVASRRAIGGIFAIDTTLAQAADGVCVGENYHPPQAVAGRHKMGFVIKLDGNPASGRARDRAPDLAAGGDLPCAGNGDGDYRGVLFESETADVLVDDKVRP